MLHELELSLKHQQRLIIIINYNGTWQIIIMADTRTHTKAATSMAKQIHLLTAHNSSIQFAWWTYIYWYFNLFLSIYCSLHITVFFQINSKQIGFCLQWILINNCDSQSVNDDDDYWYIDVQSTLSFQQILPIVINIFASLMGNYLNQILIYEYIILS